MGNNNSDPDDLMPGDSGSSSNLPFPFGDSAATDATGDGGFTLPTTTPDALAASPTLPFSFDQSPATNDWKPGANGTFIYGGRSDPSAGDDFGGHVDFNLQNNGRPSQTDDDLDMQDSADTSRNSESSKPNGDPLDDDMPSSSSDKPVAGVSVPAPTQSPANPQGVKPPQGPRHVTVNDNDIDAQMKKVFDKIDTHPEKFSLLSPMDWMQYMLALDTDYHYSRDTYSYNGTKYPDLSFFHNLTGHEINYMGVGAGFAAYGLGMADADILTDAYCKHSHNRIATMQELTAMHAGYNAFKNRSQEK